MKKIKKLLLAFSLSFGVALFCLIKVQSATQNVQAQSGEGVDACTYYYANGFKSANSCRKWYTWKRNKVTPAWNKKLKRCAISSAIAISPNVLVKELRTSPKSIAIMYGANFLACLY